ncbi:MAG: hypothetical protein F6K56_17735, partial [Moorea sp. SIO3G5]|nr:hypothetical protein [Moorena sp. SIO3G5]
MFTLINALFALIMIGILLLIGRFLKQRVRLFQSLYLPESVIAGGVEVWETEEADAMESYLYFYHNIKNQGLSLVSLLHLESLIYYENTWVGSVLDDTLW